jgi:hypothetical protein
LERQILRLDGDEQSALAHGLQGLQEIVLVGEELEEIE